MSIKELHRIMDKIRQEHALTEEETYLMYKVELWQMAKVKTYEEALSIITKK